MKSKHIFFIATSFVLYSSISLATIKTGISVIDEAQEWAQDVKEWAQDVKECAQYDHFSRCMMIREELRRSAECTTQIC